MQTLQATKKGGPYARPLKDKHVKEKPKRPEPPRKVIFQVLYGYTLKVFDGKGGFEFFSNGTYTVQKNDRGWYEITEGLPENLVGRTLGAMAGSLWSQLQDDSIFKIVKREP